MNSELGKKILLVPVLALLLFLVWFRPIDDFAERHVEDGFKRALVTFASARALNALISLAKEAQISVSIGAGAAIKPGAVLDPLDDMVEQFSAIMLAATLSFAAQRTLILLFSAWPLGALLSLALIAWAVQRLRSRDAPWWLPKVALALLCLRLAIPVVALASEATYQLLLADAKYREAQTQIQAVEAPDAKAPSGGVLDWLREWTDAGKKVAEVKTRVQGLVEHLVRVAAVFVVQTIVLPLVFLWGVWWLYRILAGTAAFGARRGSGLVPRFGTAA